MTQTTTTAPYELTDRERQELLGIGRKLLGCDHLGEDVLQDALLTPSRESEPPADPVRWLRAAVIYRSRHLRRTLRRRRHHEHVASSHCKLHDNCDNPLHVAVAHEYGELLEDARRTLSPEHRIVLDLFESKGEDYRGIAEQLAIPIGTVRSRLARARRTLHAAVVRRGAPKAT